MLLDHLGIDSLFAVAGGSMGGMQVLQWAASYPDRVFAALPIACATRHSAQNIAFHEVGRQAVMADPEWRAGRYLAEGTNPRRGLAVARMAAHITYLSDAALHRKFGRRFQDRVNPTFSFDADFEVESYLRHQGSSFVERFDANSYLYLTRAMDYFDLAADYGGVLAQAFRGTKTRFCVISFTSDWLFPTVDSRAIVHALNASSARVSFAEIVTDKGTTLSCSMSPNCLRLCAAFSDPPARHAGCPANGEPLTNAQPSASRSHHGEHAACAWCRARRSLGRGRNGGARLARTGRRVWRWRTVAPARVARCRWSRHRIVARGRQRFGG
jgi:Homoserine acetyltransferase